MGERKIDRTKRKHIIRTFADEKLAELQVDNEELRHVAKIHEYKGRLPMDEKAKLIQDELLQKIEPYRRELREISDFIHSHPEVGFKEFQASQKIADFLKKAGFRVEHGVGSLPTAIRAWYENEADENTPKVCIPAEYDALAGLGHGCGHNLIAACSLAGAMAAVDYAKAHHIPLKLCLMGTPAEESYGGKVIMIREGAFQGIDMAVMSHPSKIDVGELGGLGVARAMISFHGKASHAGAAPQAGINALDAMALFYTDMMRWRAELQPRERVHGIVTKGGDAPNIVPDLTEAFFYVRAPNTAAVQKLQKNLEASVKMAAEKVGCTFEVNWVSAYQAVRFNRPLTEKLEECWENWGKKLPPATGTESCGSTDMGDVTQIMPGAHFHFSITTADKLPGHSTEFLKAAGSDFGFESAMKTGALLAKIVLDYTMDAEFRQSVNQYYQQEK